MTKSVITNRELWKKVYKMYMVDNIPVAEIADKLGYNNDSAINTLKNKFGLPPRTKEWLYNEYAKSMFTDEQEQIFLGGILGDGYIQARTSRNPLYSETHSIHQLEYISWKQTKLYPFVNKVTVGHKGTEAYIKSVAMPQLRFYRNVFYPQGKKIIPVEAVDWFEALAIAVWYMDDGTITKKEHQIKLATSGFDIRVNGMLQGMLAIKFGVYSYMYVEQGKYPRLVLMKESNNKFLDLVEPYIIPSMRYKLGQ